MRSNWRQLLLLVAALALAGCARGPDEAGLQRDVQAQLDTYYINNWSIWLDIAILFRTIPVVVFGTGAK